MFDPYLAIAPVACVVLGGLAATLAEAFREPDERMPIGGLAVVGLIASAVAAVLLWGRGATSFGVVSADDFGLFVTLVLVVVGILTVALSVGVVERDGIPPGEYYALTMFAVAGMMLMALATDLLVMFIALEILSVGVYVLTGMRRNVPTSTEAALKYFLLGAFSSAFFLYGIAFTFGIAGSTKLDRIGVLLSSQAMGHGPLTYLALALLLVGFAFKVSAVPFHMWTPDAYEGAPTVVTGFMSAGVKAAAFAAFARVFLSAFSGLQAEWTPAVWTLSVVTMIIGTVVAVAQTNVKRMLAYSSIAHAGYLLVALTAGNEVGKGAILFYLLAYGVTSLGAFGVVAALGTRLRRHDDLRDYAGLGTRQPALAAVLTVFLLSLGGFPPTAGFVGKWYLFSAAVAAGDYGLAVIGVLTSVVSVFVYLRVVVLMYMAEPPAGAVSVTPSRVAVAALIASTIAVLYLGLLPGRVLSLAAASIATLL
jgi:NADH-quinone oxidoreductase subunit N